MAFGEEQEPVKFKDAECIKETARAILVKVEGTEPFWIPKRCVHDDSEVFDATNNAEGELVIVGWWAEENGLA